MLAFIPHVIIAVFPGVLYTPGDYYVLLGIQYFHIPRGSLLHGEKGRSAGCGPNNNNNNNKGRSATVFLKLLRYGMLQNGIGIITYWQILLISMLGRLKPENCSLPVPDTYCTKQ
jgi:hypothetical protein